MDIQFLWIHSPSPTPAVTIHFRLNLYHFLASPLPPPLYLLDVGCHKYMVPMSLKSGFCIAPNCPLSIDNGITICWHGDIVNFFLTLLLFLFLSLLTGPSFMSISSLILELWQFSCISDWPEIWILEIPPSEFCPISGDWRELGIPNSGQMSLM